VKKQPEWYYDELKKAGVGYTDIEEVQAYDLRMQKLRDIKKEVSIIRDDLNLIFPHIAERLLLLMYQNR